MEWTKPGMKWAGEGALAGMDDGNRNDDEAGRGEGIYVVMIGDGGGGGGHSSLTNYQSATHFVAFTVSDQAKKREN